MFFANDIGADVIAAGTDEVMVDGSPPIPAPTELLTGIPDASPDAEMEVVQLVIEPELQLQDGANRSTDSQFSTPGRDPATKRRSRDDMDDGPKVRRVK